MPAKRPFKNKMLSMMYRALLLKRVCIQRVVDDDDDDEASVEGIGIVSAVIASVTMRNQEGGKIEVKKLANIL